MKYDRVILALAERQDGLVTTAQLGALGVPRQALTPRIASGLLRRRFTGVYQVGPIARPYVREQAALLACGGGAISHVNAAVMLQFVMRGVSSAPVDVTQPPACRRGHERRGIRLHRSALGRDEVIQFEGCRVTSPTRTLLDLAGVLARKELEHALARAERADPTLRARLDEQIARNPHRKGAPQLRALIAGEARLVRSPAEAALSKLLERAGLPPTATNAPVCGMEVDFLFAAERLVVEVDGLRYHTSPAARARDLERDGVLLAAGYRVLRVAARQVAEQPGRVIARIAQALARES